jgi:hypothetical protein
MGSPNYRTNDQQGKVWDSPSFKADGIPLVMFSTTFFQIIELEIPFQGIGAGNQIVIGVW